MQEEDIKIYRSKKDDELVNKDFKNVIEAMNFHRSNGNLVKAKALGTNIAKSIFSDDDSQEIDLKKYLPKKYQELTFLYQAKVLMIFAAETLIEFQIKSTELTTTIINSMYEYIQEKYPVFYENISTGAAFTFYYIAIDEKGDEGENIGKAFSMLCSVSESEVLTSAIKKIWQLQLLNVDEQIKKCDFKQN